MEFLVKRTDGEWFSLHRDRFPEVLRPRSIESIPIQGWGDYRIKLSNGEIAFSFEEVGLVVTFERYTGTQKQAIQIVEEIVQNIGTSTGERGTITLLESR